MGPGEVESARPVAAATKPMSAGDKLVLVDGAPPFVLEDDVTTGDILAVNPQTGRLARLGTLVGPSEPQSPDPPPRPRDIVAEMRAAANLEPEARPMAATLSMRQQEQAGLLATSPREEEPRRGQVIELQPAGYLDVSPAGGTEWSPNRQGESAVAVYRLVT